MRVASPRVGALLGQLHHSQRPRERLLRYGAGTLSDAELLALLIGAGVSGEGVLAIAHRLLQQFDGLQGALAADSEQLLGCKGLGQAAVCRIKAVQELSVRELESTLQQAPLLSDTTSVCRYVQRRIGHRKREVFGCLFLDAHHRLICWEVLFKGSINRAHVHAREIMRRCLELNAAALVLAHNHPSGVAEPSQADLCLTNSLADLLAQIDVAVLDHVVVSRAATVSMANRGLFTTKV